MHGVRLTRLQRVMLLELLHCEEAGVADGVRVQGARRALAGRLVEKGLAYIKVVGTAEHWEARLLLTDAGRACVRRLARNSLSVVLAG